MVGSIEGLVAATLRGDRRAGSALAVALQRREGESDADDALVALARAPASNETVEVLAGVVYEHRFARAEITRVLFNEDDVEEALQETVLGVINALPGFRAEASFRTWASRIARNRAIGVLRRKRATPGRDTDAADAHDSELASFSSSLAQRRDIDTALAVLPADMAAVVRLRDLDHRSYAEIAADLGIPVNTVRSRLARGRARLRAEIGTGPAA